MSPRLAGLALFLMLAAVGSAHADDFRCADGEMPPPGQDGVWRIFKPVVVQEEMQQLNRPHRYHQPWQRVLYRVPGETEAIEAFGPPTEGAEDQSSIFQNEHILPLGGSAETQACHRFEQATFAVYDRRAADQLFADKAEMAQVKADLEEASEELARTRRELTQLRRQMLELERAQQRLAEAADEGGS